MTCYSPGARRWSIRDFTLRDAEGLALELGLDDAAGLLQETPDEEEATDKALTEIAKSAINQQGEAA